jgi:hypothetical protein
MLNVKVKGQVVKKVSAVSLKRLSDNTVFLISAPCVLRSPDGLIHVTGASQEELDTDVWDVSQKFEALLYVNNT